MAVGLHEVAFFFHIFLITLLRKCTDMHWMQWHIAMGGTNKHLKVETLAQLFILVCECGIVIGNCVCTWTCQFSFQRLLNKYYCIEKDTATILVESLFVSVYYYCYYVSWKMERDACYELKQHMTDHSTFLCLIITAAATLIIIFQFNYVPHVFRELLPYALSYAFWFLTCCWHISSSYFFAILAAPRWSDSKAQR